MIHFVGAGPGATDLITVRGAELLGSADTVVYAGSLVNPELLRLCKDGCALLDSAGMTLEEVLEAMCAADAQGCDVVRLHTGDPSLYGAIREQMDLLDKAGIAYDLCPGVSAFSGAAAALGAEYTLPGVSQTLIISRMEGRTAVPEGEKLRDLAAHGASMALYLSAGLVEQTQEELLAGGYAPDTPAAVVYKATWPEERVLRCSVGTLAKTARQHGVASTALIVVGGFLGSSYERSKLYDPEFSHGYRTATHPAGSAAPDEGSLSGHAPSAGVVGMSAPGEGALCQSDRPSGAPGVEIVAFTEQGCTTACRIAEAVGALARVSAPSRFSDGASVHPYDSLARWTADAFARADALVFVGACGIAVRAIAPHVRDKFSDPAVVCVDELGQVAVALLSGHAGGANDLARTVAAATGGMAAISTATDLNGAFAVDEFARDHGLSLSDRGLAKRISASLLAGERVTFGEGASARIASDVGAVREGELILVPRDVVVGVGCRRGAPIQAIASAVDRALESAQVDPLAVGALASIDVKAAEPALVQLARERGWRFATYSAEELSGAQGQFSSSDFVREAVGVDNVCERAAVLAAGPGARLLAGKRARDGVTVAVARRHACRLNVVGIGPGAGADLTGRARTALQASDLIVGYTTYIKLIENEFFHKELRSTGMRQELERCRLAFEEAAAGRVVSLVCSGDAGVYGMASPVAQLAPAYPSVEVEVVPGVTASVAGAAVLGAPLSHDFATVSLSDLLTPWEVIEARLDAAARADFCLCLYNPASRQRPDHLRRACDVLLRAKSPGTVCGVVRNIGRDGQDARVLELRELRELDVDMFTTVFVGNADTRVVGGRMVTPRGYEAHA